MNAAKSGVNESETVASKGRAHYCSGFSGNPSAGAPPGRFFGEEAFDLGKVIDLHINPLA